MQHPWNDLFGGGGVGVLGPNFPKYDPIFAEIFTRVSTKGDKMIVLKIFEKS